MIIQQLLKRISLDEFRESFFLKIPYSEPSSADVLRHAGSLEILEKLFLTPGTDMICGKSDGSKLNPVDAQKVGFLKL